MKKLYLDYASTTPVRKEVVDTMVALYKESIYTRDYVAQASQYLKTILEAEENDQIHYVGTGSEANQCAFNSLLEMQSKEKRRIFISAIEHPSIRQYEKVLTEKGYNVTTIPCLPSGTIDLDAFFDNYSEDVALVSVMMVNNETGVQQPIEKISDFLKKTKTFFHVDAIQALGKVEIDLRKVAADAMTFSAHKIYGPKGLGILYLKQNIPYQPIVHGATLNVPYIAGFHKALSLMEDSKLEERQRISDLKQRLIEGLEQLDCGIEAVGDAKSPIGIATLCFNGRSSDALLIQYDFKGIALSAGSACSSGAISASPVLLAMGLDERKAKSCIRFSIGYFTTEADIRYVIETTASLLKR